MRILDWLDDMKERWWFWPVATITLALIGVLIWLAAFYGIKHILEGDVVKKASHTPLRDVTLGQVFWAAFALVMVHAWAMPRCKS